MPLAKIIRPELHRQIGVPRRGKVVIKRENAIRGAKGILQSSKKIIYTQWMKKFIRENPGIIRDFMEARGKGVNFVWARGQPETTVGNTKVTLLKNVGDIGGKCWKVEVGKKKFFVKETHFGDNRFTNDPFKFEGDMAPHQLLALRQLESRLDHYIEMGDIKPVLEVAKYHLGWHEANTSFLATDFYDLPLVTMAYVPDWIKSEFHKLMNYENYGRGNDLEEKNALYDAKRGKIIILDMRKSFVKAPNAPKRK